MTSDKLHLMEIKKYLERWHASETEELKDFEKAWNSNGLAVRLGTAQAFLEMIEMMVDIHLENIEAEEAAYEQSLRKEGIIE